MKVRMKSTVDATSTAPAPESTSAMRGGLRGWNGRDRKRAVEIDPGAFVVLTSVITIACEPEIN